MGVVAWGARHEGRIGGMAWGAYAAGDNGIRGRGAWHILSDEENNCTRGLHYKML